MEYTDVKRGDRVAFVNTLGLREELLVEEVKGNLFLGRGIVVARQQVTSVISRG